MKIIMPVIAFLAFSLKTLVADSLPIIEYSSINHPVISQTGMVVSQRKSASEVGAGRASSDGATIPSSSMFTFLTPARPMTNAVVPRYILRWASLITHPRMPSKSIWRRSRSPGISVCARMNLPRPRRFEKLS